MTRRMHESADRYLRSMQAAGVRAVPLPGAHRAVPRPPALPAAPPAPAAAPPASAATPPASAVAPPASAVAPPASAVVPPASAVVPPASAVAPPALRGQPAPDGEALLAAVAAEVSVCRLCRLCETRNRTVPGEGSPRARVVFVGEGPGADEDRTGRPFVGRAGQLLDDIITKGMKLSRADVFICNVVKCRPPGNRVPEPDEAASCAGYLDRQLLAISPAVICTLGATAARRLLGTEESMGALRGRTHAWRGIPVITTYHPAYLLRNPAAKVPTWQDIQRVMELMRDT
jgi:uracil-DNA glycosylase